MNAIPTPEIRPANPCFSSGPCAKRPGFTLDSLSGALLGRNHRATETKAKITEVIDRSRALLGMPADWRLGVVPASDTGAVEIALWSLLGPRPVDILAFESFGAGWATDILRQLKLPKARVLSAEYGDLPDLAAVDPAHDFVFTWNGTTSGVRVPNADWIAADREGLAICDATSAVFAMPVDWDKIDVATWSWQKVLGGEAAHGMLALSPRAVARLESHEPTWPMPKVFRLTNKGKLTEGIFRGDYDEHAVDAMCRGRAGRTAVGRTHRRSAGDCLLVPEANLKAVADFVAGSPSFDFLANDPATRSNTSICLKIVSPWFLSLDADGRAKAARRIAALLEKRGIAYDIGSYRDAPPGLRIWGGATVESADIKALMPWCQWAHDTVAQE